MIQQYSFTTELDIKLRRKLGSAKDPLLHVDQCIIEDTLPSTNL
jgi:hypothetical protein